MSSSQFFNPILNPEFDPTAYVAQAMAADNGLETGAAVGPSHAEAQRVEAEPEVVPDEEAAQVPAPQDLRSNPEVSPPADSQPEKPEVASEPGTTAERISESTQLAPEAPRSELADTTPSDALPADRDAGEAPVRSDDRPEVAVEAPGEVIERDAPDLSRQDVDTKPLNAAIPEFLSTAKTDLDPATDFELPPQPEAKVEPPLQYDTFEITVPSPEPQGRIESEPAEPARYEPAELEDSFDVKVTMNEAEVWEMPEHLKRVTVEAHRDDIQMDLNDALGPGVSRKEGY